MRAVIATISLLGLTASPVLAQDSCSLIYRDRFEDFSTNALAVDDADFTTENSPIDINVLINDQEPGGLGIAGCPLPVGVVVEIVNPPPSNQGQASVLPNGFVRFAPAPDFVGESSFTYRFTRAAPALRSNPAEVTVSVRSTAPTAVDDQVLSCDPSLFIHVLDNDRYPWPEPLIDAGTVLVDDVHALDNVVPQPGGSILFSTQRQPPFVTGFSYSVANDLGRRSQPATVTVTCPPAFDGEAGLPPVDGVDVLELDFLTFWRGTAVQGGIGSAVGMMHIDAASLDRCRFVGPHTQACRGGIRSETGAAPVYEVSTGVQVFTLAVQPDGQVVADGVEPGTILPADGSVTVVAPQAQAPVAFAPSGPKPAQELQSLTPMGMGTVAAGEIAFLAQFNPTLAELLYVVRELKAAPDALTTRKRPVEVNPDIEAESVVESDPDPIELGDGEEILALPADGKRSDGGAGEQRARLYLLPEATRHAVTSRGRTATGLVTAALVARQENQSIFTAAGQRPVPIRLGFGVAVPGSTLTPPRFDACLQPPDSPTCTYGPHPRLLAVNQNGDVTVHHPDDGRFLYHLIGGGAPNFTVDNGWHIVQDPNTACLLFSDSGNQAIHRYDTNGQLLNAAFISTGASSGPRGMDFLEGDLLVATSVDGRIRRYRSDGSFVADQLSGTGNPNAVFTLPGGDLLVVDESGSAGTRTVRRYPSDGGIPEVMVSGLGLAYQIAQDFDGHYLLAHFGLGRIEVFNFGFPQIAAPALGSNDGNTRSPRGIAPLRNGKWLVSGNNGTGVAVLDPQTPESVETLVAGNTFRFIEPACLPQ